MAVWFAAAAGAAPICVNDMAGHQYYCYDTFGPSSGNFVQDVPLPQFDPALGTLTKVEHYVSGQLSADFTITNREPDLQTYNLTAQSTARLYDSPSLGTLLVTVVPLYTGSVDVASGATVLLTRAAQLDAYGVSYTAPLDAARQAVYVGTGTVPFTVRVTTMSGVLGSGDYDYTVRVNTDGLAKVIYSYDAVPEPAALFLAGGGLLLLGAVSRRARRVRA